MTLQWHPIEFYYQGSSRIPSYHHSNSTALWKKEGIQTESKRKWNGFCGFWLHVFIWCCNLFLFFCVFLVLSFGWAEGGTWDVESVGSWISTIVDTVQFCCCVDSDFIPQSKARRKMDRKKRDLELEILIEGKKRELILDFREDESQKERLPCKKCGMNFLMSFWR